MKVRIQLIVENESGVTTTAQIAALERRESDDGPLGGLDAAVGPSAAPAGQLRPVGV